MVFAISIYLFLFLLFTIALVHKTCSSKIIKINLLQSKEKTLIQLIVQRFFSMIGLFSVFSWLLNSFIFSSGSFFWVAKKQSNLSFREYYHHGWFLAIIAQRASILAIPIRKIKQNSEHWKVNIRYEWWYRPDIDQPTYNV